MHETEPADPTGARLGAGLPAKSTTQNPIPMSLEAILQGKPRSTKGPTRALLLAASVTAAFMGAGYLAPWAANAGHAPTQPKREYPQVRNEETAWGRSSDPRPLPVRHGAISSDPCALGSTSNLNPIAHLSPASSVITFGDTDHDGFNEVFLRWRDSNFTFYYLIDEEQGNNSYSEEYLGASSMPLAVGDLDGDGRSDLVGQWGSELQVYESLSTTSYPTNLVWTYPVSNFIVPTVIADTDRDGQMEIIYFRRTGSFSTRLTIFECTGDNTYIPKFELPTHNAERPIIDDLDGDGRIDIAYCGAQPSGARCQLTVVESAADDLWSVVFTDSTDLLSGGEGHGGSDTDGNGRPELFFSGLAGDNVRAAVVYEPCGDNCYEHVTTLYYADGTSGVVTSALGDIDGVGSEEYLLEGGHEIQIFRPVAHGQWLPAERISEPSPTYSRIFLYDVNRNGIPELFWLTAASDAESTTVLEQDGVPTSIQLFIPTSRSIRVSPTPSYGTIIIFAPGAAASSVGLTLYDVSGRQVTHEETKMDSQGYFRWAPDVPAGVYFLRLDSPHHAALGTGRVVIVK